MVQSSNSWRELARFDDLPLARAVATSIASMEFDVRVSGADSEAVDVPDPPYRIEVHHTHWHDLADIFDEIVDEQVEFDRRLAQRGVSRDTGVIIIVMLTGTVDLFMLLRLLEA